MRGGRHRSRVWQRELRCGPRLASLEEKLSRHQVMAMSEKYIAGHDKDLARHQHDYDSNDEGIKCTLTRVHGLAFIIQI